MKKTGFVFTIPGDASSSLTSKIKQFILSNLGRIYDLPIKKNNLNYKIIEKRLENFDSLKILKTTIQKLEEFAQELCTQEINTKTTVFNRLKGNLLFVQTVLQNLNYFREDSNFLEGRFWLPKSEFYYMNNALKILGNTKEFQGFRIIQEKFDLDVISPPTKYKDSTFLVQFQSIVDTYGVPKYKEVNPAILTSVTFPFLFGIMFGDAAHGTAVLIFGLFLYFNSKSLSVSLQNNFLQIKSLGVLLTFMGFFAIYCGLMYNDFVALPITFIPSCYSEQAGKYGNNPIFHPMLLNYRL